VKWQDHRQNCFQTAKL